MKGANNIFVDKNSLVSGAFSAEAKNVLFLLKRIRGGFSIWHRFCLIR